MLAEIRNLIPVQVTVAGQMVDHEIPKRSQCWNCHIGTSRRLLASMSFASTIALEGKTQTQLQEAIARGWLTQASNAPILEITDPNTASAARSRSGYTATAPTATTASNRWNRARVIRQLDLRHDKFMGDTIGKPTMTVGTAVGTRVVPGRPLESILFLATEGRMNSAGNGEVKMMPPAGVKVPDAAAVARLRQWIMSLPPPR